MKNKKTDKLMSSFQQTIDTKSILGGSTVINQGNVFANIAAPIAGFTSKTIVTAANPPDTMSWPDQE